MNEFALKIQELLEQVALIKKRQNFLVKEILKIEQQIEVLQSKLSAENVTDQFHSTAVDQSEIVDESSLLKNSPPVSTKAVKPHNSPRPNNTGSSYRKSEIERFIGENLISVIGISVLVIGIAIGVKYAIDKDLISPLSRILLGYGACSALLAVSLLLTKKYQHFSAVLLSGALAGLYFVTFVAYDFYLLLGKFPAFFLMLIITVSTVFASLKFNRQIIAQIGLVGAYAIPFLLDDGRGGDVSLFTYMTIINAGILFVAVNRYWRSLYYSSFILSWIIFLGWYFFASSAELQSFTGPIFLVLFFVTFYATFLFYKVIRKEHFKVEDVIFLLTNVFIFYGIGTDILRVKDYSESALAIFTGFNAVIHGSVSYLIHRQSEADRKIVYLTLGLALLFFTLAIPVYWDGNWVTLIWLGEAVILTWIGTRMSNKSFITLSFVLTILAVLSLFQDWEINYDYYFSLEKPFKSVLNINFLSSLLCVTAMVYMGLQFKRKSLDSGTAGIRGSADTFASILLFLSILVLYLAGFNEITYYWGKKFEQSIESIPGGALGFDNTIYRWDYKNFKSLWIIIYSMLFISSIGFINTKIWINSNIAKIHLGLSIILLLIFLVGGLYEISELRDIYLGHHAEVKKAGIFHLLIRYIAILAAGTMLSSAYFSFKIPTFHFKFRKSFDISVALFLFGVLSSELYHWMDVYNFEDFHKLGLSIFWGIFAVLLIGVGIFYRKRHVRILAILIFLLTLLKLFFYDISHLTTISKTVVFVSLGILLLIISFLYNKYKNLMLDELEK